jgi:hypothetical protein
MGTCFTLTITLGPHIGILRRTRSWPDGSRSRKSRYDASIYRSLLPMRGSLVTEQEAQELEESRRRQEAADARLAQALQREGEAGHERDLPPPLYADLEEVRALDAGAGAEQALAQAGRPRLAGAFGGASARAPSLTPPAPPPRAAPAPASPAASSGRGADGLRILSELMDEAARDAESARECAASGQKEQANQHSEKYST